MFVKCSRIENLRQLVQWCEVDVRTAFEPTFSYPLKTMENIHEIQEMESWFPRFHFSPNMCHMDFYCLNDDEYQVFQWKWNRCCHKVTASDLSTKLYVCVTRNTPKV